MTRTYLDSNVLIAYTRGTADVAQRVQELIDDPQREFISTSLVELEVLPQAKKNKRKAELAFYEMYFEQAEHFALDDDLIRRAEHRLIKLAGLQLIDSLHLEAAVSAGADEFITDEKLSKPLHAEKDIKVSRI